MEYLIEQYLTIKFLFGQGTNHLSLVSDIVKNMMIGLIFLPVFASAGEPLVQGVRMVVETQLLAQHAAAELPEGMLIVVDPEQTRADPTRLSLDDDAMALVFVSDEELGL